MAMNPWTGQNELGAQAPKSAPTSGGNYVTGPGGLSPGNPLNQVLSNPSTGLSATSAPDNPWQQQIAPPKNPTPTSTFIAPGQYGNNPAGNLGAQAPKPVPTGTNGTNPFAPPGAATPTAANNSPYTYVQDAKSFDPLTGQWGSTNPLQFATQETADRMSKMFGAPVGQVQLSGPDAFSTPQLMIGNGSNAGLLADLVNKYGYDYAKQIYDRDTAGHDAPNQPQEPNAPGRQTSAQSQALAAQGYSPQVQQNMQQGQGYQQQQQNIPANFLNQIMSLYSLLQQLGLFQGQGYQRPPAFSTQNPNGNFFSQFA